MAAGDMMRTAARDMKTAADRRMNESRKARENMTVLGRQVDELEKSAKNWEAEAGKLQAELQELQRKAAQVDEHKAKAAETRQQMDKARQEAKQLDDLSKKWEQEARKLYGNVRDLETKARLADEEEQRLEGVAEQTMQNM